MTNLDRIADAIRADQIRQGVRGVPETWAAASEGQRDSYRSMALAVFEADGPPDEQSDSEVDTLVNQLVASRHPLSAKAALTIRALRFEARTAA